MKSLASLYSGVVWSYCFLIYYFNGTFWTFIWQCYRWLIPGKECRCISSLFWRRSCSLPVWTRYTYLINTYLWLFQPIETAASFSSLPRNNLSAVVSTLVNFVRMFVRSHEENCKQLEFEKKRAIKEAEKEQSKLKASLKITSKRDIKKDDGDVPNTWQISGILHGYIFEFLYIYEVANTSQVSTFLGEKTRKNSVKWKRFC